MHRRTSSSRTAIAVAVLLVLGLVAGCSSSDSSSTGGTDTGAADTGAADSGGSTSAKTTNGPCADTKVSGKFGDPPQVEMAIGGETPKALVKKDIITGSGEEAKANAEATMNYALYLCKDGTKVESSFDRGEPFSAALEQGGLIDGWVQGVPGMKVGGRRMLVVPPDLAYGSQSQPGLPANSTLLFVIDLVSVP